MSTTLIPPGQWAQNEFGFAQLGDLRRNKRLVNIAEHLAASPGGTLPQAFPDWAELKAAYRFFGQRGVSFERVLARLVDALPPLGPRSRTNHRFRRWLDLPRHDPPHAPPTRMNIDSF